MTAEVTALLPKDRPRYLMGVGRPEQIADYVALGIDMMDCVLPTRAARHACLYTSEGRVLIKNSRYAEDQRPIDSNRSEEHTSELQSRLHLVCRLLLEKKNKSNAAADGLRLAA